MAVVAAFELDDLVAAGEGAREAHRGHRRLGAGVDEAHELDRRHRVADEARQLDLELGRGAEAGAALGRLLQDLDDGGWAWPRISGPHEPT